MPAPIPPAELHYQLTHWQENISPDIIAVNVALVLIATIAVLLRLISRKIKVAPMQSDDYVVMLALVVGRES